MFFIVQEKFFEQKKITFGKNVAEKMSMTKPKNKRPLVIFRNIYGRLFFIIFFIWLAYIGVKRITRNYLLNINSIKTKAVIIDEKNYLPNSDVSFDFTYSYCFVVDGKLYKENSHNESLKVGDTILVEYAPSYPNFNRPITK